MKNSVVAVVVTFNRKDLLARCLASLINQTEPVSKVVVVDNASTDGTKEFLSNSGYLANPVIDYRLLPENIGGAGGFNKGIQIALTHSPNWIWLMDDDGYPDKSCLSELLNTEGLIKGPLVIDDMDHAKTSFPYLSRDGKTKDLRIIEGQKETSPVHPFNGVMISTQVIADIGLPNPRYFIWGDEIEYRNRWQQNGYDERVNVAARFFHPSDRQIIYKGNRWSIGVPIDCSRLRKYCFYRNQTHLNLKTIGFVKALGKVFLSIPDVLSTEINKALFFRAAMHGLFGVFGKHKAYI